MLHVDSQTIGDLGFDVIRDWLVGFAVQPTAAGRMASLGPCRHPGELEEMLGRLGEWILLRESGVSLPAIDFHELTQEIGLLQVREGVLPEESFARISRASALVNELLRALGDLREGFPLLWKWMEEVYPTDEIITAIDAVFDARWQVRDDASPELLTIRQSIVELRRQVTRNFNRVLKDLSSRGFLGDTGEAFLNNRRVLAVYSTHKRKVGGLVVGSSNTGNLTYIEPEVNVPLHFELESLYDDERREVRKILGQLTRNLRRFLPLIGAYQTLLTRLDELQARGRLARMLEANIPALHPEPLISLHSAYHPLLKMSNEAAGRPTYPQHIQMDRNSRMLVISGPNAGGKSITLKTVGLLQLMFQCGLAIPAAAGSALGYFTALLTDIGDNQSIENQLSTYSYRLRRMKYFLEMANRRSLVLLDEFGTGSDPDLGGALAEVFFEELYRRKSFGVITTHYGNIKLRAASLPHAVNGCMLFNSDTLEPTYRLSVGQPGSSFTFEVAEMNGIPQAMIAEARSRLSEGKVKLDQLLSSLQAEKSRLEQLSDAARKAGEEANRVIGDFEKKKERYEDKLSRQSETIERNNKYLHHGRKMAQFVESWNLRSRNKELMEEIRKYIVLEKTKMEEERLERSLKKKAEQKKEKSAEIDARREMIRVGSLVRLSGTRQTGEVLAIDGSGVTVAIGVFRTHVDLSRLIFIR